MSTVSHVIGEFIRVRRSQLHPFTGVSVCAVSSAARAPLPLLCCRCRVPRSPVQLSYHIVLLFQHILFLSCISPDHAHLLPCNRLNHLPNPPNRRRLLHSFPLAPNFELLLDYACGTNSGNTTTLRAFSHRHGPAIDILHSSEKGALRAAWPHRITQCPTWANRNRKRDTFSSLWYARSALVQGWSIAGTRPDANSPTARCHHYAGIFNSEPRSQLLDNTWTRLLLRIAYEECLLRRDNTHIESKRFTRGSPKTQHRASQ